MYSTQNRGFNPIMFRGGKFKKALSSFSIYNQKFQINQRL
jgi:hypothetical protein